jgi:chromate transporter
MLDAFKLTSMKIKRICIVILIYFLTFGKEIRAIFGIEGTPLFDISTVNILFAAIFFIFFSFVNFTVPKGIIGSILTILYLLYNGKSQILMKNQTVYAIVCFFMVILVLYSIIDCIRRTGKVKKTPVKNLLLQEAGWIVFLFVLSLPAIITFSGTIPYIFKGLLSSLVSFGGGEAYLSVAEGMFLGDGVTSKQLYGQILPVVNALPGSILCKMLSAIGYYSALNETGSMVIGYLTALSGLAVSITASCGIVFLVIYIYEKFEELEMFVMLSKCIRPIVGGLLLSTATSLLNANISVGTSHGWTLLPSRVLFAFLLVVILLMKKFTKLHNVVMILICGMLSLVVFHIL